MVSEEFCRLFSDRLTLRAIRSLRISRCMVLFNCATVQLFGTICFSVCLYSSAFTQSERTYSGWKERWGALQKLRFPAVKDAIVSKKKKQICGPVDGLHLRPAALFEVGHTLFCASPCIMQFAGISFRLAQDLSLASLKVAKDTPIVEEMGVGASLLLPLRTAFFFGGNRSTSCCCVVS